jgi:hypothetical protein
MEKEYLEKRVQEIFEDISVTELAILPEEQLKAVIRETLISERKRNQK